MIPCCRALHHRNHQISLVRKHTVKLMGQSTFNLWSLIISIITGVIVLTGALIAVRNLRIIANANRLSAYEAFTKRWSDIHAERLWILEEFDFDPDFPPTLDSEIGQKLRKVINGLNEIGLLIDQRILPPRYVLSLCYSDFVRLYYHLQGYLEYRENELGVRYGRRLERMAQRARNYHDARPHNRVHPIRVRVRGSSKYTTIYKTYKKSGIFSIWQRLSWASRRIFGFY